MNGYIQVYIDGECAYEWFFELQDYKTFPYQEAVDMRKVDYDKLIEHLWENVAPNFDPARTRYQIAYESKMNYEQQSDYNEAEPGTGDLATKQLQDVQQGASGATPEDF